MNRLLNFFTVDETFEPLRPLSPKTLIGICSLSLIALILLNFIAQPNIGTLSINTEEGKYQTPAPFLGLSQEPAKIEINFQLYSAISFISDYQMHVDDCLINLKVNGQTVPISKSNRCLSEGKTIIPLGNYLSTGTNSIKVIIENSWGDTGFYLLPYKYDKFTFSLRVSISVLFAFLVALLFPFKNTLTFGRILLWLTITAIVFYFLNTPFWVRGHDEPAHLHYLYYIAKHQWLPSPNHGWETFQPPLYYILTGSIYWLALQAQLGHLMAVEIIQILSLFLFLGGCYFAYKGFKILTKDDHNHTSNFLIFLITLSPALVFVSGRISNDTLYLFFSLVIFYLTISWWHHPTWISSISLSLCIAITLLTKLNALVYLIALAILITTKNSLTIHQRMKHIALSMIIIGISCGWFFATRIFSDDFGIIGNANHLPKELFIGSNLTQFTTFNPIEILHIPFNNPWENSARRQFFWEFFFRSFLFGEFPHKFQLMWLPKLLLITHFIIGSIFLIGIYITCKNRLEKDFPVLILLIGLTGSLIAARLLHPYSAVQDFRFIPLFAPLYAYFAYRGYKYITSLIPNTKIALHIVFLISLVCSMAFLVILSLGDDNFYASFFSHKDLI